MPTPPTKTETLSRKLIIMSILLRASLPTRNRSLVPPPQKQMELPNEFFDAEETDFNGRKTNPTVCVFRPLRSPLLASLPLFSCPLSRLRSTSRTSILRTRWDRSISSSLLLFHPSREESFTTYRDLSVWCGTWNVNGHKVDEDIAEWLTGEKDGVPDVCSVPTPSPASTISTSSVSKKWSIWPLLQSYAFSVMFML